MNKKIVIIVVIIAAILMILLGIRLLSGEDNWICQNGEWIRHGNPSAPAPNTSCK